MVKFCGCIIKYLSGSLKTLYRILVKKLDKILLKFTLIEEINNFNHSAVA